MKKYRFTGEFAKAGERVVDVLEDGSLQVDLFLPASAAGQYLVGQEMPVQLDARGGSVVCKISRVGRQLEPAPPVLKRFFRRDEPLLALQLELPPRWRLKDDLPLGSIAKVPSDFASLFGQPSQIFSTLVPAGKSFDESSN